MQILLLTPPLCSDNIIKVFKCQIKWLESPQKLLMNNQFEEKTLYRIFWFLQCYNLGLVSRVSTLSTWPRCKMTDNQFGSVATGSSSLGPIIVEIHSIFIGVHYMYFCPNSRRAKGPLFLVFWKELILEEYCYLLLFTFCDFICDAMLGWVNRSLISVIVRY